MSGSRPILILWALALGLITYREWKKPAPDAIIAGMPRPWAYSGASVAYAIAALVGEANQGVGTMLAIAWTVAIFLGYFGAPGPAGAAASPPGLTIGKV